MYEKIEIFSIKNCLLIGLTTVAVCCRSLGCQLIFDITLLLVIVTRTVYRWTEQGSCVNFIHILFAPFSYESALCSFSLNTFWLGDFCQKNIGAKTARKMLMKLTTCQAKTGFTNLSLYDTNTINKLQSARHQ